MGSPAHDTSFLLVARKGRPCHPRQTEPLLPPVISVTNIHRFEVSCVRPVLSNVLAACEPASAGCLQPEGSECDRSASGRVKRRTILNPLSNYVYHLANILVLIEFARLGRNAKDIFIRLMSGVNYSFASATIRIPGGLCGKGSGVALLGVGFGVVAGRRGLAGFCPPEGGQTSRADGPCVLSI